MTKSNAEESSVSIPRWFLILGGIILLWNLMGLMAYVAQMMMSEEALAELPDEQQALYSDIPIWVNVCFTLAVIGGTLGSVGLLVKKKWAVPAFAVSLFGVIGQYGYMFFMTDTASVMGAAAMVLPVMVVLVAIALIPYSLMCGKKGWLN